MWTLSLHPPSLRWNERNVGQVHVVGSWSFLPPPPLCPAPSGAWLSAGGALWPPGRPPVAPVSQLPLVSWGRPRDGSRGAGCPQCPGRLCKGLGEAGSLSRCEREGGSWRGRRVQPPDAEPGSPVPAARQLGFRKLRERREPGKGLASHERPPAISARPFFFYNPFHSFQKRRMLSQWLTSVTTNARSAAALSSARSPLLSQALPSVHPSVCPSPPSAPFALSLGSQYGAWLPGAPTPGEAGGEVGLKGGWVDGRLEAPALVGSGQERPRCPRAARDLLSIGRSRGPGEQVGGRGPVPLSFAWASRAASATAIAA